MCKKIILVFIISIMFMSYMIQGNCADDYDDPDEISCADRNIIYNGIVESSESQENNCYQENNDDFNSYGLNFYMELNTYDSYDQHGGLVRNDACLDWDWDYTSCELYY